MVDSLHLTQEKILQQDIYPILPQRIQLLLEQQLQQGSKPVLTGIRLRVEQPVCLQWGRYDTLLHQAEVCSRAEITSIVQLMSHYSRYAIAEDLKQGFLTLRGGHRVGIAGQVVVKEGEVQNLSHILSLHIRIARSINGCAAVLLPYLQNKQGKVYNTLFIAPPGAGKTTVLREVLRCLSEGVLGKHIGIVDERSELAACHHGSIGLPLGARVDVLDGCPKAIGLIMLIRSMGPDIVATDEIGRAEDVTAIWEAIHAGVSVMATVHGETLADVAKRPYVDSLLQAGCFQRYVLLSAYPQPGTIRQIINHCDQAILYEWREGLCC